METLRLSVSIDHYALIKPFTISTGTRTHQAVLSIQLEQGGQIGRGEGRAIPYRGETVESLRDQVEAIRPVIEAGVDRHSLLNLLPANGARAALDAALWDLNAKQTGQTVATQLGILPRALPSAYTISLDAPEAMARQTELESWRPLLKVKLGGNPDQEEDRIRAVARAAGVARLVIDANAGWSVQQLMTLSHVAADCGFELIEQPLPQGSEDQPDIRSALRRASEIIPLCADESFQTLDDLDGVRELYQSINIKLDKCGGLTSALKIQAVARQHDVGVFVGCMLASTVAIAPAFLLAQDADYVDLDGPFWFSDEPVSLTDDGRINPISPSVWGG